METVGEADQVGPAGTGADDAATRSYLLAVDAIRGIYREIGRDGIPDVRLLQTAARGLAALAVRDPAALLGLTVNEAAVVSSLQHSVNVGVLAMALSASLGHALSTVEETGIAGFLHDVGKTKIDQGIVDKPGKLTELEYDEMKRHPEYGALILLQMEGIPERVADGVLGHHIRFDRGGYPEWARERPFGVMAAIVAVVDCYDAATTLRSYQQQMQPAQAAQEIRSQGGTSLDGEIVQRFLELAGRFPVGSLVRLDNDEIAVVFTPSSDASGAATVKVVRDGSGAALAEPVLKSLAQSGVRIVDLVDPLPQGIDVSCCF